MQLLSALPILAFACVACGGSTDADEPRNPTGGTGGSSSGGSGGSGGIAGSAGAGTGGVPGTDGGAGFGGWGPSGEHGLATIPVGYAVWGPDLTENSVFFATSAQQNAGTWDVMKLDKLTGNAIPIGVDPGGTEHLVSEDRVYFAGHGPVIEGPPPDGWLKIIDVGSTELKPFATFSQMTPFGLVLHGDHVWFVAGNVLRRIPVSGGAVEDVVAVTDVRPLAASGTRIHLVGTGITAYDTATGLLEPLITWTDAWSDQKLRGGWFYWRTMTGNPTLVRAPQAGGTPVDLAHPSGIHFDIGAHLFRDEGACPSSSIVRADVVSGTGEPWVTGLCYASKLALDGTHLYFFASQLDNQTELARVDVN